MNSKVWMGIFYGLVRIGEMYRRKIERNILLGCVDGTE
jgi:hypothetical protein